jgi:hypothetical protein
MDGGADWFRHPDGRLLHRCRAIVYDSWLLWSHALPESSALWPQLEQEQADAITALAGRLQAMHRTLPGYSKLDDSPFRVSAWWDPSDADWADGDRVRFRLGDWQADELALKLPGARALSEHWLEFSWEAPSADRGIHATTGAGVIPRRGLTAHETAARAQ